MRLYRFRSLFSLLLTGFIFVSLPLLTALFSSIQIMDGLVQQSEVAVFGSVNRMDSSRKLIDRLHDQERKARLYNVLGETDQLSKVNEVHEEVDALLSHFADTSADSELLTVLLELQAKENHLIAALNKLTGDPEVRKREQERLLGQYESLSNAAKEIELISKTLMTRDVKALEEKVQMDKKALVWQVSGLIGFSVMLVVLFISLITKPIRQIDKSIERLGEGDFSTPVKVSGTRDLEAVGSKLDWLRKRLDKLDREKVKMVAHISHELKTPLASIKEGAGLLKDGLVGPLNNEQDEVVGILDKNCGKLQKLIENILDFNMAQARQTPIDLTEIPLEEVLQEIAEDHHNSLLARQIELQLDLFPVKVVGNRKQVKTIFDNLMSNAIKFTPDNGRVRVSVGRDGGFAETTIEDSGPGITEEDRSQVFSPFFQGEQTKNGVVKGSGLGLAIGKEYAQNCGGNVRLLPSKAGARFLVTLPLQKGQAV